MLTDLVGFIAIIGMEVIQPEVGRQPGLTRVSQQTFTVVADVGKVQRLRIRFPDDKLALFSSNRKRLIVGQACCFGLAALRNIEHKETARR